MQDLIPNHALNKAADWFIRQRISLTEEVLMEVPQEEAPQDIDVRSLGYRLVEEAKAQAAGPAKSLLSVAEESLNQGVMVIGPED